MGAGVVVGVFWGLVLSALVVTVVSLSAPLPPRSDQAAGAPVEIAPETATETETETASGAPAPQAEADESVEIAEPETPQSVDTASDDAADSDADASPSVPHSVPPAVAALEGAQPGPSLDPESGAASEGIPLPAGPSSTAPRRRRRRFCRAPMTRCRSDPRPPPR